MISDTLFEAVAEIENYEHSFGGYAGLRAEIGNVKAVMQALLVFLDHPPGGERFPKYQMALDRLRAEIANLNVTGLAAARDALNASWPAPDEPPAAPGS